MLNRGSCALRLFHARHVLAVLTEYPDMAQTMGFSGPQSAEIQDGWRRYETAFDAYYNRQAKAADAMGMIDTCDAAFKAARAAQARLTALARIMITTPSDRDRLGLSGRRSEVLGRWLVQARVFHQNLTDADRVLLSRVGVHAAELEATHQHVNQLSQLHADCIAAKAAAKAGTESKTLAFKDLAQFISRITTMVRTLEPTNPDLAPMLRMTPDGRRKQNQSVDQVHDHEFDLAQDNHDQEQDNQIEDQQTEAAPEQPKPQMKHRRKTPNQRKRQRRRQRAARGNKKRTSS